MNKPNFKISGLIATGLYGQRQSMRCRPEKDFRDCSVRELGARIYIQDFERDPETGLLTDTGRNINIPHPVCVILRSK